MTNDKIRIEEFVCEHGHVLSTNVYEYDVNRLTNEKVIRGKRNLNENDAARPPGLTNL